MDFDNKELRNLAERIYDLDKEVYEVLESSVSRVFHGDRERCVNQIMELLHSRVDGSKVRGELALISNMARTIKDKPVRKEIMTKYNEILEETMALSTSFGGGDILDPKIADLNTVNLKERFGENDHLIICIGRTYGCGGNEIGFTLAEKLKMNFYDVSIMNEMIKRMEDDNDDENTQVFSEEKNNTPVKWAKDFIKNHGLSKKDVQFFNSSKYLVKKAKEEDFIVMGRFADAILTNNRIPHISIFITAPERRRIERIMLINKDLDAKSAKRLIEREDKRHLKAYKFYTGRKWSKASNYDLCINSASYGINGAVEMILRMLKLDV